MAGRFTRLELDEGPRESEATRVGATTEGAGAGGQQALPASGRGGGAESLAPALLAQARDQFSRGRFEPALRLYTRCLQEDRRMVAAWVGQVRMLTELNELHEARLWCDQALELFRNQPELLAARAQACARLHERAAALAASDASLRQPGSSAWRWLARGEVLLARDEDTYPHVLRRAVTEPDADWVDQLTAARICLFHDRAAEGLLHLAEVLARQPQAAYAWAIRGDGQRALGLTDEAAQSYQQALRLEPHQPEARHGLQLLARGEPWTVRWGRRLRRWLSRASRGTRNDERGTRNEG